MATEFDQILVDFPAATVSAEPPAVLRSQSDSAAVQMPAPAVANPAVANLPTESALPIREASDGVNRFLLCSLVTKSARYIKERGQQCGEHLTMKSIVKGVLQCYNRAAELSPGLLAGPQAHMPSFRELNRIVLREQITASVKERARNSQHRLDRAIRLGDQAKIEAEKEALARDRAEYHRLIGGTGPHDNS